MTQNNSVKVVEEKVLIEPRDKMNRSMVVNTFAPRHKNDSAKVTVTFAQSAAMLFGVVTVLAAVVNFGYMPVLLVFAGVITMIYVVVILFKSMLTVRSMDSGLLTVSQKELEALCHGPELPTYTILVPLYKEHGIVAKLISNLNRLDYPQNKLQIILLLEEDDKQTIAEIRSNVLPSHFETLILPDSQPKTKPKACNEGLRRAIGEFTVIYDAEDRPEIDQLKKAVVCFRKVSRRVVCVQAKLEYFNPYTNWITKFFSAEYATYFNLILPGLGQLGMPVPLGGTSNHFRTRTLLELGGWDGFNVTEDIDMGIRIARRRLRVKLMDSVTWEEANSHLGNLIRQRSRWKKGGMVTYFVHMRNPIQLYQELGFVNFFAFQVIVLTTPLTLLVNPIFWTMTIIYELTNASFIQSLYPLPIFYLGIFSIALGNILFVLYVMTGCKVRGLYGNIKWMVLAPLYWGILSLATWKALWQMITRPHYWEKTNHGFVEEKDAVETEKSARPTALGRTTS